jgi:hypothetical protein
MGDSKSRYQTAAAARRAKIGSITTIMPDEVKPSQARISLTVSGKAIDADRKASIFGPTSIQIPEFSDFREKKRN